MKQRAILTGIMKKREWTLIFSQKEKHTRNHSNVLSIIEKYDI
jgi:hypothetical protein